MKNKEPYALQWRIDSLHMLNDNEIAIVSSLSRGDFSVVYRCFDEIIKRIEFYVNSGDDNQHQKIDELIDLAFDCLIESEIPDIERICWLLEKLNEKEGHFSSVIKKLVSSGNVETILEIPTEVIPEESVLYYWDNFVLACCDLDISFLDRPEKESAKSSVYGTILTNLSDSKNNTTHLTAPSPITSHQEVSHTSYLNLFFYSLACNLSEHDNVERPGNYFNSDANAFAIKAGEFFIYAASCISDKLSKSETIGIFDIYGLIEGFDFPKRLNCDFDESSVWHAVSKALTHISITLYRLLRTSDTLFSIDMARFNYLASNDWWIAKNWLQSAVECGIQDVVPRETVENEVASAFRELSSRKDNTATLANESLELTQLASLYDLKDELIDSLRLTANHILGYGYRKDITLHEMYEAIEACGKHNVGNIPDWVRRLSPFTNDIFDFTEREIRHIPRWRIDLMAQFLPERLADEFEYHLSEQNRSVCQDIIEKLIEYFPLDSSVEKAFLLSQTTYESLNKLGDRATNNPALRQIFDEQIEYLGGFPPTPREISSNSTDSEKNIEINVSLYPPENLNDLCDELKSRQVIYEESFLESWINYWVENDRGLDIVTAYESLLSPGADFPYILQKSLDTIFSLSLKLRGKKKSYALATRSIRENRHWDRYWGSRSEDTILNYARIYKKNWKGFLKDTLSNNVSKRQGSEWVYVPTCGLVKLFLAIGEVGLAIDTTEVMLKCLEDEIAHLPLSPPYWKSQEIPQEQVPAHLLLWYYKWPDRVVRLRSASKIADLLQKNIDFRPHFLEHLSHLKYEVDVTDYLSILLFVGDPIYSLDELSSAIKYPSILSDLILRKLGYQIETTNNPLYHSKIENADYSNSDAFKRAQNGLAPAYLNFLKRLGKGINYPLVSHCSYEWECIRDRQGISFFNHHNFSNDQFYPQDKISCSVSSHAETIILSAYLRTISYAHENLEISDVEATFLANKARPFGTLYGSIQPSKAPKGWPVLSKIEKEESLPDENDLKNYLKSLDNQDEILLHASGPLVRMANGVCLDLDVRVFQSGHEISMNPEAVYKALDHDRGYEIGVYPLTGVEYPEEFGRWEVDRLLRGFYIPEFLLGTPPGKLNITPDSVEYLGGDILNATWKTWYQTWYPAFYKGLGPSLGTYMTIPKDTWDVCTEKSDGAFYLLGRLKIIDRRDYNAKEKPDEVFSIIRV